jgi:hypothetical protein
MAQLLAEIQGYASAKRHGGAAHTSRRQLRRRRSSRLFTIGLLPEAEDDGKIWPKLRASMPIYRPELAGYLTSPWQRVRRAARH